MYSRPEKYKIDIVNFMGWREQHFSDSLEAIKNRAKSEIESRTQPKDLMIYRKAPGFDNWTVIFSYWFHEASELDKLTD